MLQLFRKRLRDRLKNQAEAFDVQRHRTAHEARERSLSDDGLKNCNEEMLSGCRLSSDPSLPSALTPARLSKEDAYSHQSREGCDAERCAPVRRTASAPRRHALWPHVSFSSRSASVVMNRRQVVSENAQVENGAQKLTLDVRVPRAALPQAPRGRHPVRTRLPHARRY